MEIKNQKIIVTGATGFIGEHIVQQLINRDAYPAITVRQQDKIANPFKNLPAHQVDLLDLPELNKILSSYDVIIHCAGRTGKGHLQDPVNDFKMNAICSINLMKAAVEQGVKKFINFSSYAIYGNPQSNPMSEDHVLAPNTPYAGSVLTRDYYARIYHQNFDLNIVTLRLFNVYGNAISQRNRKGIIPFLVDQIRQGEKITITGHPEDSKDFVYVDDVTQIVVKLLEFDVGFGESINVGSGTSTNLKVLADTVIRLTSSKAKVEFSYDEFSSCQRALSAKIGKLQNMLSYDIEYSLEKGINAMLGE